MSQKEPSTHAPAPALPTCPTCLAHVDDPPPQATVRPTLLRSVEEVRRATDGKPSGETRHAAHKAGVRHWYRLESLIACSFQDKTPHKLGYVVETLCKRVVNVGHVCGRNYIYGHEMLIQYVGESEQYGNDLANIRSAPAELDPRAATLEREVEVFLSFKDKLEAKLPSLAAEMQRRADRHARQVKIQWKTKRTREDGRKVNETRIEEVDLKGLELWADKAPHDLRRSSDTLCHQIAAALADGAEPDAEAARRLAQRVDHLQKEMAAAGLWLSRARTFFDNANMAAAVFAAGLHRDVNIENKQLHFYDREKRANVRLGLGGFFFLDR